jgi:hypothetical protein
VLKDGVLQQVDTPRELYDRPLNNVFVAGLHRLARDEPPSSASACRRSPRSAW